MLPLRLVVDTNILVSATLNPDRLQRTTLLLALTEPARLYVTLPILEEYAGVLMRPHLQIRKGEGCGVYYSRSTIKTSAILLIRRCR